MPHIHLSLSITINHLTECITVTTLDVPYAGGLAGWRAASAGGAVGLAARAAHVRPRLVIGSADSAGWC